MDYAVPRTGGPTLAQQPPTVKPLGGKSAGQAGCIAAPQTLIPG